MTDHYYTRKPSIESDERMIEGHLLGMQLTYVTDQGVFSKASVDFGSRLLIETFNAHVMDKFRSSEVASQQVLDLGCGYGAMGLAFARKHPTLHVTLADINERAVGLARKNASRFGVQNVSVLLSDGFQSLEGKRYDWIITNPPIRAGKQLIHGWFERAYDYLNPGGSIWIVIQKKQGAPSAYRKLEEVYGNVEEAERDKGYSIYFAVKK